MTFCTLTLSLKEVFKQLENLSSRIDIVSRKVYEELFLWRMKQQKSLSGGEKPEALDELQHWYASFHFSV